MKYLHTQRLLVFATVLLLLAGCGRSDQFGDEMTPQSDAPTQDAAVAPEMVAPEITAKVVYPAPDAAEAQANSDAVYPGPDAAAAVAPDTTGIVAYPAPSEAPPAPGDELGFVNIPAGEIGVVIDPTNNKVVDVIGNSPAQAAGIEVGDVITQVEGKAVGDKFKDAKQNMGDKLHKQVKIEVERQGKKRTFTIKTDFLIFPTVAPDQPTPTPIPFDYIYL